MSRKDGPFDFVFRIDNARTRRDENGKALHYCVNVAFDGSRMSDAQAFSDMLRDAGYDSPSLTLGSNGQPVSFYMPASYVTKFYKNSSWVSLGDGTGVGGVRAYVRDDGKGHLGIDETRDMVPLGHWVGREEGGHVVCDAYERHKTLMGETLDAMSVSSGKTNAVRREPVVTGASEDVSSVSHRRMHKESTDVEMRVVSDDEFLALVTERVRGGTEHGVSNDDPRLEGVVQGSVRVWLANMIAATDLMKHEHVMPSMEKTEALARSMREVSPIVLESVRKRSRKSESSVRLVEEAVVETVARMEDVLAETLHDAHVAARGVPRTVSEETIARMSQPVS